MKYLEVLNNIRYDRTATLDELGIALYAMDVSVKEILDTTEFDDHGNITKGRKAHELYNLSYGIVEKFVQDTPGFCYQRYPDFDEVQRFQMSHFYSRDYAYHTRSPRQREMERQMRIYGDYLD